MRWRWSVLLALILSVTLVLLVASAPPSEPLGGAWPVTKQRLLENELISVGREPKLTWTFDDQKFVLRFDDKAAATKRAAKLIETLTGEKAAVSRIEGNWQLEEKTGMLVLSKIKAGGKEGRKEAQLKIAGAGAVRANLGDHQYNLFPRRSDENTKKSPSRKE